MNPAPVYRLQGVSRRFDGPPEVAALRDATFDVRSGEFVSVVGRSGSGKSTLLNLLGLLDHPSEGRLEIFGREIGSLRSRHKNELRAQRVGFVFQESHVIPERTAEANVALKLTTARVARERRSALVDAALRSVGLVERAGARASTLSGGERQRLALARAIALDPEVLLADEPTGNLDARSTRSIVELLQSLHATGLTIVLITHDEEVAAAAERRLEVADGIVRAA